VVFQTDYICEQTSAREMLQVARSMPADPAAVYSRTMHQINSQPKNQATLANRILDWLAFAQDKLTLLELVEALAVEVSKTELDPLNKPSPAILARICRGLVTVDEGNNIVQLAHRTVHDYLLELRYQEGPRIHREISATCLTYLSFDVFHGGPCLTFEDFQSRSDRYVFQHYAVWYVGRHVFLAEQKSNILIERLYRLITCKPLVGSYLQARKYLPHGNMDSEYFFLNNIEGMTELHVAALMGLPVLTSLVVERSPYLIDERDDLGMSAITLAVTQGHTDVTRVLLESGANILDRGGLGGETLLNCAARCRFDDIVELLLQHRFPVEHSVDKQSFDAAQQLLMASIKGDEELTKEILATGVDVDARDSDGGTALQWAAWYGYSRVLTALLDHGADINAKDHTSGRAALHEAAEHGNLSCVEILLQHGAEVNARDVYEWTSLHRAATQGGSHVVNVLLQHGASINMKTFDGQTPLDLACESGQEATIHLLLQNGDLDFSQISPEALETKAIFFRPSVSKQTRKNVRIILEDSLRARQNSVPGIKMGSASTSDGNEKMG